MARLTSSGTVDPTFGSNGIASSRFFLGNTFYAAAMAVQADGKILLAGKHSVLSTQVNNFAIVRYTRDGALDTTFSGDGKLVIDSGPPYPTASLAVQADQKIVAASAQQLFRFTETGDLDTTFDGDGRVIDTSRTITDMAIQRDGKIVVAGRAFSSPGGGDFGLWRYTSGGALDTTFDTDGRVTTDFGTNQDIPYAVVVQADGKIVAGGSVAGTAGTWSAALARYMPNGALDPTFGTGGKVTPGLAAIAGLELQLDGKIVTAGDFLARYHGATDSDPVPDGIADSVDTQPLTFSNDFSDGTTTGTITDRGDQTLLIIDSPDPSKGVVISAELSGGPRKATVTVNNATGTYDLKAGDRVTVTKGSLIADVHSGPVDATYVADGGQRFTGSLPTGTTLTFVPETGTFTAPATNPAPVFLTTNGTIVAVTPGGTLLPTDLRVSIDVKPGASPNTINLGSNGTVPVAILSTATFNATTVDPLTVSLAGAAVRLRGNGSPQVSLEDVNGDGRQDLVVHVVTQALELTDGDVNAVLLGETTGGLRFQGIDTVRVINPLQAVAVGPGSTAPALTQSQAEWMAAHALARWAAAGVPVPGRVEVEVADLPDGLLGAAGLYRITLDRDAAGWGWFVDPTPWEDSEFLLPGDQGERNRMDLLSVLMHEIGHLLGFDHDEEGVMHETLAAGERHVSVDLGHQEPHDGLFADAAWIASLLERMESQWRK